MSGCRSAVRCALVSTLLFVAPATVVAGTYGFEYGTSDFLPQTPGVTAGAPGGFYNPAAWAAAYWEYAVWGDDRYGDDLDFDTWGFSVAAPVGFAMERRVVRHGAGELDLRTYQLGIAGGDRRFHLGAAWRWFGGDDEALDAEGGLVLGGLVRYRHLSLGLSGFFSDGDKPTETILDAGVRPFGRPFLTLFGDYAVDERQNWSKGKWGAGVELRPYRGISFNFKVREATGDDDVRFQTGLGLAFDGTSLYGAGRYDEDFNHGSNTSLMRVHPPYRGLPVRRTARRALGLRTVVAVDLQHKLLTYRKARWFDDERVAWLDLATYLDEIQREPTVSGVALNLSGFRARPSLMWELRRKLQELRDSGKTINVYVDRLGMSGLYLASVADEIMMDPRGQLILPGLAIHRTYLRGALERLGLAAEEWRYFSHKTAFQRYSRSDMSEADHEQLGRVVDVIYETWRDGICDGRGMAKADFDAVVDDLVVVTAAGARERGLVDEIGRWHDLTARLGEVPRQNVGAMPKDPDRRVLVDERWGRPPEIAVVYALGECAMDTGINGRATSRAMRRLANDRNVAAVVLRADSPGGDPLPSDLIAEATRMIRENGKPVVVSQGDVAASGGYWISMDGTRILTTPFTITGSIGVIGGWVWDDGFSDKTGLTADGVQRGRSADLFTGIHVPFLGAAVPERNLTDAEHERVKELILAAYDDFVEGVAEGRDLSEEKVREIGEGRVWMGGDAMERGLTDAWGGLDDAVREAKALAGLDPDEEVIVTEYPPRQLFRLPRFLPELPWVRGLARRLASHDAPPVPAALPYECIYLESMAGAPGRPLYLVPPEEIPTGWGEEPTLNRPAR